MASITPCPNADSSGAGAARQPIGASAERGAPGDGAKNRGVLGRAVQDSVPPDTSGHAAQAQDRDLLLVAVHGWLLSSRLWSPLVAELAPRRALWCPDLPGFGQRPRPRGLQSSLASYGRWLADAVRERAAGRPVVLIGQSLGGSIALHSAAHLGGQLRGLVQIAAGGGIFQPRPFALIRRGGAAFVQWRPGWLAELPGTEAIRSPLRADPRAARGLLACSTNRGAVRQLPLLTSQLAVPSLWISGSRDRVMEPRYVRHLASFTPLHRLDMLKGGGHLPMRQRPRELAQLIETWLQQELMVSGAHQAEPATDQLGRAALTPSDQDPLFKVDAPMPKLCPEGESG